MAEVVLGASLPGTPPPVATVTTDGETWHQISLKTLTPLQAIRDGRLKVDGALAFSQFISRFDRSLLAQPIAMP